MRYVLWVLWFFPLASAQEALDARTCPAALFTDIYTYDARCDAPEDHEALAWDTLLAMTEVFSASMSPTAETIGAEDTPPNVQIGRAHV